MSSGSTCAAVGCYNNTRKLKILSDTCREHKGLRQTCLCPAPYAVHAMPRKEERKQAWLAALRIKYPLKRVYVCSFHFVDKRPTKLHPDPELHLGHDQPPPMQRPRPGPANETQTTNSSSSLNIEERWRWTSYVTIFIPCFIHLFLLHWLVQAG